MLLDRREAWVYRCLSFIKGNQMKYFMLTALLVACGDKESDSAEAEEVAEESEEESEEQSEESE